MQSVEFDNLMTGKPAKWADLKKVNEIFEQPKNKPFMRSVIQRHEEPIPNPTRENIDALIMKLRNTGMKESKVRRIVKNTFHIIVI